MVRHRLLTAGLVLLVLAATVWADPPKGKPLLFKAPPEGVEEQALADRIDKLIEAAWLKKGVKPAELTDDAEFFRRVNLDLAGRVPWASQVRDFLDDKTPNKRALLIDKLVVNSALSNNNFTAYWRNLLIPQNNNNQFGQNFGPQIDPWLRKKILDNTPYDQIVREILTVPLTINPAIEGQRNLFNQPTPRVFYQANESKPENLAAATSRLFLGIRLECAQCHDHPFAKWSREDFWSYAAFFAGVAPAQRDQPEYSPSTDSDGVREIKIPGKDKTIKARFLDGKQPKFQDGVNSRVTLAEWVTSKENPFFAKAAVNRVWAHLFGVGIVDPVDEPADDNPPSHPELLDELAKAFVDHNYDLKFMMRAIARSRAYQLTSAISDPSQLDPRTFSRMSLKGLTAEQFFDSIALATGYEDAIPNNQGQLGQNNPRAEFLARFSNFADKRTETQTSILQALALMNGRLVSEMTSTDEALGQALIGIDKAPFMTTPKKIDSLYLSTLSRKPTAKEMEKMTKYVDEGGPTKDSSKALGDVFWALLNSSEFIFNH